MSAIDKPLAEDRFREKTTVYLRKLAQRSAAIEAMYFYDPAHEDIPTRPDVDLFFEKRLTKVKGLVTKYPGRALLLLSWSGSGRSSCRSNAQSFPTLPALLPMRRRSSASSHASSRALS